jgi:lipoyl(octanoyl) transferase
VSARAKELRVERMGRVPYGPMLALQEERHRSVADGLAPDTLFLLEHEAVVTLGKNAGAEHVLVPQAQLAARGVELFATGRGGDVTYHGPGQLVGYPVIALGEGERDIRAYVERLEEIVIRTVADFGIQAQRLAGLRGIWVGNEKIGAIGVRIARWTTLHGFALNVAEDLSGFGLIVPCGLHGRGVTSIARQRGRTPSLREVEDRIIVHAGVVLGRRPYAAPPSRLGMPAGRRKELSVE